MDVRTYVHDVMAIKPNFLTSMGYHIFLAIVLGTHGAPLSCYMLQVTATKLYNALILRSVWSTAGIAYYVNYEIENKYLGKNNIAAIVSHSFPWCQTTNQFPQRNIPRKHEWHTDAYRFHLHHKSSGLIRFSKIIRVALKEHGVTCVLQGGRLLPWKALIN